MTYPRATFLLLTFFAALPAYADRVITTDGRVVTPTKARETDAGYRLEFEHGQIVITNRDLVQAVEIEGDMSDYVPKNDDERDKLDKGFVRFEGKWLSKPAYEAELQRRYEESKARLDEIARYGSFHNPRVEETKHFIFRSDLPPELHQHYLEICESYYDLMDKRFGIKPTPTYRKKKMTVNAYKSYEEFHEFSKSHGLPPTVIGFFSPGDDTLNFYHDYSNPILSQNTAIHECTHLLTFLIDQQYLAQIWLNEAVADYFGSSKLSRDKRGRRVIEPGAIDLGALLTVQEEIRRDEGIPLADLMMQSRENYDGRHYDYGWSFAYFLNYGNDGKYQSGFDKFFKEIYTTAKGLDYERLGSNAMKQISPEDIRDHLLKRIKVKSLDELEAEWKEFILGIEVDGTEARLQRGFLRSQRLDFEAAIEDLDIVIDEGSVDPRAFWARARARFVGNDYSGALEDLDRAIEIDPLSGLYRFERSTMIVFQIAEGASARIGPSGLQIAEIGDLSGADEEQLSQARSSAGLAMELDPENDRYREWFEQLNK